MAQQYPTNEYSTEMGMNRPYSNNLAQGAQNQYGQMGPSYGSAGSYGSTASNQTRSNPWNNSAWGRGGGQYPTRQPPAGYQEPTTRANP